MDRRPLKTRSAKWAHSTASILARSGITPNHISLLSLVFSVLACASFYLAQVNKYYFIAAAIFVQLRLACNLLDGMVAVEHQRSSPDGELYNDVPDRFADAFIIMGAALAIPHIEIFPVRPIDLGWLATVVAIITAYIRVLGKSLGTPAYFFGPMAKPHRMFFITVASLVEMTLVDTPYVGFALYGVLSLIIIGGMVAIYRRLSKISQDLMGARRD